MTKLYLRNIAAHSGMPADEQSTALPDAGATLRTAPNWTTQRGMSATAGASQVTDTATHDATTTHYDWKFRIFGWAIPAAQTIAAQNWTIALAGNESNTNANTNFEISLYVYRSGFGVVTPRIIDAHAAQDSSALYDEFTTGEQGRVETIAGSAVSGVQANDVLVLEVWQHVAQAMTTAYTSSFYFDGATDPVDNTATSDAASYVESTDDLSGSTTFNREASLDVVADISAVGERFAVLGRAASLDITADISVSGESVPGGGGGNPRKVQNLVATAVSTSQINLSWDNVSILDPVAYDIERDGIVILENYTGSHSVGSPYQDTGLDPNTLYVYRVRAVG